MHGLEPTSTWLAINGWGGGRKGRLTGRTAHYIQWLENTIRPIWFLPLFSSSSLKLKLHNR
jgi:hypothetical protein